MPASSFALGLPNDSTWQTSDAALLLARRHDQAEAKSHQQRDTEGLSLVVVQRVGMMSHPHCLGTRLIRAVLKRALRSNSPGSNHRGVHSRPNLANFWVLDMGTAPDQIVQAIE